MLLAAVLQVVLAQAEPSAEAGPKALIGRVVDAEGEPAVGVEVILSGIGTRDGTRPALSSATTGADGRFRLELSGREDSIGIDRAVWAYREGTRLAGRGFQHAEPPAEADLTMTLGPPAEGPIHVRGPEGEPIAGARVRPVNVRIEEGLPSDSMFPVPDALAERLAATTDAEGRVQIPGLAASDVTTVSVVAEGFGEQYAGLAAGQGGTVQAVLGRTGRIAGRVVGEDAGSISGLKVRVTSYDPDRGGLGPSSTTLVATDEGGRFEVRESAAGTLNAWVILPEGSTLRSKVVSGSVVPGKTTEVVLTLTGPPCSRTVSGRVVDREGRPVPGAVVFQTGDAKERTEVTTDAEGRFALPGVAESRAFLFATKEGYCFTGGKVTADETDLALALIRADEEPESGMATLPPPLPHDEEMTLARQVLAPYAERVLANGGEGEKIPLLEALARAEPARALESTEGDDLPDPYLKAMIRMRVGEGLIDEAPDEAVAIFESIENPGARALGLLLAADALPEPERARKLELIDRALVSGRTAKEPTGMNVIIQASVAEHWLDLGLTGRATDLLRDVQEDAENLPDDGWSAYAKGAFAEELSQIDPEAALELTKGLADPREYDRHHGNIAQELAARDPAAAERALGMIRAEDFQRDQRAVRVLDRMAAVDLERARRIASEIGGAPLRAFGLGMMALGLIDTDRATAESLLREAFDTLDGAVGRDETVVRNLHDPATIGGVLLPVAEAIDPRLVPEFLWRTIALRPPVPSADADWRDAQLAVTLARYDRDLARALLEPLARPGDISPQVGNRGLIAAAAALIDPRWAVEIIEALPEPTTLQMHEPANAGRLAMAHVLARRGERRWRYLQSHFLHLWVPGVEDIGASL